MNTDLEADVIVVGAGSGGSAVTRRLVDAGLDVVLLESGPRDTHPAIHDPGRSFELIGSEVDYAYLTVEQPGCAGRRIVTPRGKVLGGSSSINGMIYARGDRVDYDAWAYLGNAGWSYDDVLPLFRRSEDFDRGADEYHGAGGPLHVASTYEPHETLGAIVEAAVQAGLPFNEDYNGASKDGASFIQLNIKDGERHNAFRAFVEPVLDAANLTVQTDCSVHRLLLEHGRCVGVELVGGRTVRARQEVVLAAGVIDSAKILLLSGIGPADELRPLGIDPVVDLPGVGKNLHDHFYVPYSRAAAKPIPPTQDGLTQFHAQFFWRSRPGLPCADIQALIVHYPIFLEGQPTSEEGFSPVPMLVRPASRGALRLVSADPGEAPLIDPRYLTAQADVDALVAALELCREIAAQPALADWAADELNPGPAVRSRQELRDYVRRTGASNYHPVGTCKMGIDELAVVDPELRVYGVEALRIADASVMPNVPSANTHAPTVMIGERAAELVAAAAAALPALVSIEL